MRTLFVAALTASALGVAGISFAADAGVPSSSPSSSPPAPASSAPASSPSPAPASSPPPAPASSSPPTPAPDAAPYGLAVLAAGDTAGLAWPLARATYANSALRPANVDEAHARVLAGETPAPGAPKELTDLAETRAAIKGDDAPSRQLLVSIATKLGVRGIVVVMPGSAPHARVFAVDTSAFDAALYAPDAIDAGEAAWSGAVASLARAYGAGTPGSASPTSPSLALQAPSLALSPTPKPKESDGQTASRPFYLSPWFWGAVGAAAFGGAALYFATRDNGADTIHLQLQVPK